MNKWINQALGFLDYVLKLSNKLSSIGSPEQILKIFSIQSLCRLRELIWGPTTYGAFIK
jgi:hypothetical protein